MCVGSCLTGIVVTQTAHNWNFKNIDDVAVAFCTTSETCQWKLLFERLFRMKKNSPKMASSYVVATLQWVNF
jgi:hypothetical protein